MAAVTIKPAQFNEASPTTWFAIIEAQFHIAGITQAGTKFYHALSHLPSTTVSAVPEDIITGADYDKLKAAVIAHHEATKPELFEQFMRDTPLVGRPSHFLNEMKRVATRVGVTEDFIRHRFQQALPNAVAPIVASQKTLGIDEIGKLADELMTLCPGSSNLCAVSNKTFENRNNSVPKYFSRNPNANNNFPNQNSRSNVDRTLLPFSEGQRSKICRSHIFFAEKARNCRSWCAWPNKNGCTVVQSRHNTPHNSRPVSPSEN